MAGCWDRVGNRDFVDLKNYLLVDKRSAISG
jgi:hypothetical protein